jgi:hypothetical protein
VLMLSPVVFPFLQTAPKKTKSPSPALAMGLFS